MGKETFLPRVLHHHSPLQIKTDAKLMKESSLHQAPWRRRKRGRPCARFENMLVKSCGEEWRPNRTALTETESRTHGLVGVVLPSAGSICPTRLRADGATAGGGGDGGRATTGRYARRPVEVCRPPLYSHARYPALMQHAHLVHRLARRERETTTPGPTVAERREDSERDQRTSSPRRRACEGPPRPSVPPGRGEASPPLSPAGHSWQRSAAR